MTFYRLKLCQLISALALRSIKYYYTLYSNFGTVEIIFHIEKIEIRTDCNKHMITSVTFFGSFSIPLPLKLFYHTATARR